MKTERGGRVLGIVFSELRFAFPITVPSQNILILAQAVIDAWGESCADEISYFSIRPSYHSREVDKAISEGCWEVLCEEKMYVDDEESSYLSMLSKWRLNRFLKGYKYVR